VKFEEQIFRINHHYAILKNYKQTENMT